MNGRTHFFEFPSVTRNRDSGRISFFSDSGLKPLVHKQKHALHITYTLLSTWWRERHATRKKMKVVSALRGRASLCPFPTSALARRPSPGRHQQQHLACSSACYHPLERQLSLLSRFGHAAVALAAEWRRSTRVEAVVCGQALLRLGRRRVAVSTTSPRPT